jgi:hypothetical protein
MIGIGAARWSVRRRIEGILTDGDGAMAGRTGNGGTGRVSRWRIAAWGLAAGLLLLPLIAMQFTDEVIWGPIDFAVFGAMLLAAGGAFELAVRISGNRLFRAGVGVAVAAAFLLVWVNLAVGYLGDEDNPANLMFLGVLAVAILGSGLGRFQPAAMSRAMLATAVAQVLAGLIGLAAGWASPGTEGVFEVTLGTFLFTPLWLASAWLLRQSGRGQSSGHLAAA